MDQIELENLKTAATAGDVDAQFKLGDMYYWGDGVDQDNTESAIWFRKAADQGHKRGQYSIGYMYTYGLGVTEDPDEADRWMNLYYGGA